MRIKGVVRYNGSNYYGWQKQPSDNSVEEEIEKALSKIFNSEITIYGSGRTDAKVHALKQVFHFDINKDYDLARLKYSLNLMLNDDIHILSLEQVDNSFNARYDVKVKTYLYRIILSDKDPFNFKTAYICPFNIDFDLLKQSLLMFVGKHDFKDFTSKEEDQDNFIREIYSIDVKKENNEINITFKGNGFMRYMIRFIVGTCLEISKGREDISFIKNHLDSKDRNIVSYKAPPEGLYLFDIDY